MSQSLSNTGVVSVSASSQRTSVTSHPLCSRFSLPFKLNPIRRGSCDKNGSIRAMGVEQGRDDLDHLQRPSKQQSQPKRRVAQVAPVGLWDRFPTARTVQQMMETMERMMDDPFAYGGGWASPASAAATEGGGYGRGRTPWEIKEREEEYKMRFDMPGMTKEDLKVWVEEKMLVVKAEKVPKKKKKNGEEEEEEEEEETETEWSAKSYGRYSSRIALPENVQFEKIKAEVKDGVLYISIPKADPSGKILDIRVQ
ncbi:small heat shock protein, chloroplastic-like [Malania oleifera]|uniref:small heat shock protein, chloroplastic-like n=1 Tax=Malania oleifera TaxID=397392 RepID=UPI0025AEA1E0|nr:small heat shock protein, chloroplastic-like [Malania oleifera]